ncbi:hypothetical protein [Streptomyces subrutilus]|uniref:hypothetical protein n=1 Tax=Streptomyces subrutilus TaxID=36818 RepID=UPI002E132404|nr:hypothetical protein OG479_19280 [Streptomyces subrutilus]
MNEQTNEGLTRNSNANERDFSRIRKALQRTEAAARGALETGHPKAEEAYEHARLTLALVDEILFPANRCIGLDCVNPVQDKGIGRPALYCGQRCKDRAAYARKRQTHSGKGEPVSLSS